VEESYRDQIVEEGNKILETSSSKKPSQRFLITPLEDDYET